MGDISVAVIELELGYCEGIPRGKRAVFDIPDGRQLLILHTRRGFVAIENSCPHAGATLNEALLKGNSLMCVWHGWRFDLRTGQCSNHPGTPLKQFPIRIQENKLLVSIEIKDD